MSGRGSADVGTAGTASFTCPRCQSEVQEEFYGPCAACRSQLRATVRGERSGAVAQEYEPKMNVTPNAVALKDD